MAAAGRIGDSNHIPTCARACRTAGGERSRSARAKQTGYKVWLAVVLIDASRTGASVAPPKCARKSLTKTARAAIPGLRRYSKVLFDSRPHPR
jgi:hypothetical protein